MDAAVFVAVAGVMTAAVTGLVAWLVSRRTSSGQINTSEAAKLWDEGTNMRLELREEVTSLKQQLHEATTTMHELTKEIRISRDETARAQEEARKSREETRLLMAQIAELSVTTHELHDEVKTSNKLTIGALADNAETRRIQLIPESERSPVEAEHLATAGDRQPQSDRPEVESDEVKR